MQMTKQEAKTQVEAFFEKIGDKDVSVFNEKNFAKALIGEAIMGFVYNEDETLLCQSLIYRFRKPPQQKVMEAIEFESQNAPKGGGEIAFDEENFTLVLQRDYQQKVSEDDFYNDMQKLAKASLIWSDEVLQRVAERAIPQ